MSIEDRVEAAAELAPVIDAYGEGLSRPKRALLRLAARGLLGSLR